jgi:hypothetical protein
LDAAPREVAGHDVIEFGTGNWDRSHRISFVKLDRVLRVPTKTVRREGATLERNRFDHVVDRLQAYHR